MARPRVVLPKMLRILKQRSATGAELCKITKKSSKIVHQYLKVGIGKNLIEQDSFGKYHLSPLGEQMVDEDVTNRSLDSRSFEVNSQVVYPPNLPTQPAAKCTIHIENPDEILRLDKDTHEIHTALLKGGGYGTYENITDLKASAGMVVSAILDLKARQMGLLSNLRSEYADTVNIFNYEQMPGGYDNLKRLQELAKTKFVFMVKFDGRKWVKDQNFEQIEKRQEEGWKSARNAKKNWRLRDLESKINLIAQLVGLKRKTYEELGIFESDERMRDYIYKVFTDFRIGQTDTEVRKEVDKAFDSGLLKCKKNTFYYVNVDTKHKNRFLDS
jgi:hypothetical protein